MADHPTTNRSLGLMGVARAALIAVAALVAFATAATEATAAPPANDDFSNATVLAATLPANESGSLAEATSQSGEPHHVDLGGGHTVWYRWKPTVDTTVAVGTCGSASYAAVAVYGQGPVNNLGQRLGTESGCLNGTGAIVHAQANHDYWIAIEDVALGSDAGNYSLKLEVAGSLAGRVLDESNQPVADHCVKVIDPATGTAATTAETGSDGRWFVELPPASYRVRYEGCSSGGPYAREWWQNASDVDAATTVSLAPGQARTGIDAKLEPAASIAGDLTRPGGAAVANACVTVFDPDHPETELDSTTTDLSGHYRVSNLAAGPYKVLFEPGCAMSSDLKDEYYNDKGTFATADIVTLTVGQQLTGRNAELGDGGSISGTVRNASSVGIGDICVSATPVGGGPDGSAQTAGDGTYTVPGLDPGSYTVQFSDCSSGTYANQWYLNSPDLAGSTAVSVAREQDRTGINASLLQNGGISGKVTGPGNEDLENVCVKALDISGNEIGSAATEGNGTYSIAGLAQGQYRIHFVDCGSGAFVDEYYDNKASLVAANPVPVTAGNTTPNINAQLSSAGAITGFVTGPGGGPAEGVCVSALNSEGEEMGMGGTDDQGYYLITHLSPGGYKVVFRDCGPGTLATEFYNDQSTFSAAANVVVDEGLQTEDINAQLAAGGAISGTVTAENVAPAADTCVTAFSTADAVYPVATASADVNGDYVLRGLRSGTYNVYFDGSCSPEELSEEFFNNAATFAAATAVTVTAPNTRPDIDADLMATQSPTVTIDSGPTGPIADATPTYTFTRTGGGAVECSVDTGTASYGPCSNALSHTPASNLADGSYTFRVRVSNAAGDQTQTRSFSVDTTAPAVSISGGPNGPTNAPRPTFTFSSEAGSSIQCSVDTGTASYGPCSGTTTHQPSSDLGQGPHTFRIRATDEVGNSSVATRGFSVDTVVPTVSVTGGPTGATNNARPTFTFDSEAGSTVQCSIDTGTPNFGACSAAGSHQPPTNLGQGAQTFRVRATDSAGNINTATRGFTVDTVAPETSISGGPAEGETITTAGTSITFTSSEPTGAQFECKLDSGSFQTCSSPRNLTSLSNGSHTFEVRATDAAGNVDGSPATRTFIVDTSDHTPPETTINSGPANGATVVTSTTSFGFTSNEAGSTFECKLDSGSFQSCNSPRQLTGLTDGSHTFSVQATDSNGNTDPTPATRTFTVAIDNTAPDTVIDGGPAGTITTNSATFTFRSTEPTGATFECKLDGGTFQSCTSPRVLTGLADGAHSFQVRATDAAGNVDATPATQAFTVQVPVVQPPNPPDPPDNSACEAAQAQLKSAQTAMTKAKAKMKKAKSKAAKKKAKVAVKKAKKKVSAANSAVAGAC